MVLANPDVFEIVAEYLQSDDFEEKAYDLGVYIQEVVNDLKEVDKRVDELQEIEMQKELV